MKLQGRSKTEIAKIIDPSILHKHVLSRIDGIDQRLAERPGDAAYHLWGQHAKYGQQCHASGFVTRLRFFPKSRAYLILEMFSRQRGLLARKFEDGNGTACRKDSTVDFTFLSKSEFVINRRVGQVSGQ